MSTDVGGTDPDDFQSMVHLLVYADVFAIEGLISSPYGPGRKAHLLECIDAYEKDVANLESHSDTYPAPDALRAICKQGAVDEPNQSGLNKSTEGSEWIIKCAQKDDPRPLHVLVWGGIEDLSQALHALRPGDLAKRASLLDWWAKQEVECECLQLHRAKPSETLDDRSERHVPGLVRIGDRAPSKP